MAHLLACCLGTSRKPQLRIPKSNEKTFASHVQFKDTPVRSLDDVVNEIWIGKRTISTKEINESAFCASGWSWEEISKGCLNKVVEILQTIHVDEWAPVFLDCHRRAASEAAKMSELAEEFAHEHPILTAVVCVVLALGILFFMFPWMLTALGFGELGPVEGSFAASWQSLYGGWVPVGSLFSYLQRLGMVGTWPF